MAKDKTPSLKDTLTKISSESNNEKIKSTYKSYSDKLKDPRWQRKRLEIFKRDDFQCQMCFDREETQTVHHKWYTNGLDPWEYPDECYITLCEDCHESVHLWEKNCKKYPEQYIAIPFENVTDLRILLERMFMIQEAEGNNAIHTITQLLTAYIITEEDF